MRSISDDNDTEIDWFKVVCNLGHFVEFSRRYNHCVRLGIRFFPSCYLQHGCSLNFILIASISLLFLQILEFGFSFLI